MDKRKQKKRPPKVSRKQDIHGLKSLVRHYDEKVRCLERSRKNFYNTVSFKGTHTPRFGRGISMCTTDFKASMMKTDSIASLGEEEPQQSDRSWLGLTKPDPLLQLLIPGKDKENTDPMESLRKECDEHKQTIRKLELELARKEIEEEEKQHQLFQEAMAKVSEELRKKHEQEMQELKDNLEKTHQNQYDYMKQQLLYRLQGNETRIRKEERKSKSIPDKHGQLLHNNQALRQEVTLLKQRIQDESKICGRCKDFLVVNDQLDNKLTKLKALLNEKE